MGTNRKETIKKIQRTKRNRFFQTSDVNCSPHPWKEVLNINTAFDKHKKGKNSVASIKRSNLKIYHYSTTELSNKPRVVPIKFLHKTIEIIYD